MATPGAVIGGIQAGTNFARLQQSRKRDEFDRKQTKLGEYNSIVGQAEKTLKSLNEQMAIKRAAAPTGEDQARIDAEYQEMYKNVITPLSRAGESAMQQGIPVDVPVELARLVPFQQLPDLNAEAIAAGERRVSEEAPVTAAAAEAVVPAKQALQESATTQDIRLAREKSRLRQQELGIKARLTPEQKAATSEFAKTLGKEQAKSFTVRHQGAIDAGRALQGVENAKRLLDEGVVTGAGAEFLVSFGKGLERLGFNLGDELDNSQAFLAAQASQVANIIKQFGAGTGLSDADREFATKAAAGDIAMSEGAIREIIRINETAYRNVIKDFNKSVDEIEKSQGTTGVPFEMRVSLPPRDVRDITNDIRTAKTVEELRSLEEELRNVNQP